MSEQADVSVRGRACIEVSGNYFSNEDHGTTQQSVRLGMCVCNHDHMHADMSEQMSERAKERTCFSVHSNKHAWMTDDTKRDASNKQCAQKCMHGSFIQTRASLLRHNPDGNFVDAKRRAE